jgi:hypothetical protein
MDILLCEMIHFFPHCHSKTWAILGLRPERIPNCYGNQQIEVSLFFMSLPPYEQRTYSMMAARLAYFTQTPM